MKNILFVLILIGEIGCKSLILTPDGNYTSDRETYDKTIYIYNRSFEKVGETPTRTFARNEIWPTAARHIPASWESENNFDFASAIDGTWARYYQEPIYPSEGTYYLSLNARPQGHAVVFQRLMKPMLTNSNYRFSFVACNYQYNETLQKQYNFHETACRLEIWGENSASGKREKLYSSVAVNGAEWKKYELELKANMECDVLLFKIVSEVENGDGAGNILLDDLSNLVELEAES